LNHEISHLAQAGIIPAHVTEGQPCFYFEGEAEFFGWGLNSPTESFGVASSAREIARRFQLTDVSDWVDFLASREVLDSEECWNDGFNYHVGHMIVERAYGEFGQEKWDTWRRSLNEGRWRESFSQFFGVEVTDWYRDSLVPYIRYWCKC
jgi:hypothetical protein